MTRALIEIKVFAGVYPIDSSDFPKLEESINRVCRFSCFFYVEFTRAMCCSYSSLLRTEASLYKENRLRPWDKDAV